MLQCFNLLLGTKHVVLNQILRHEEIVLNVVLSRLIIIYWTLNIVYRILENYNATKFKSSFVVFHDTF
jgi:hypothetical protein